MYWHWEQDQVYWLEACWRFIPEIYKIYIMYILEYSSSNRAEPISEHNLCSAAMSFVAMLNEYHIILYCLFKNYKSYIFPYASLHHPCRRSSSYYFIINFGFYHATERRADDRCSDIAFVFLHSFSFLWPRPNSKYITIIKHTMIYYCVFLRLTRDYIIIHEIISSYCVMCLRRTVHKFFIEIDYICMLTTNELGQLGILFCRYM